MSQRRRELRSAARERVHDLALAPRARDVVVLVDIAVGCDGRADLTLRGGEISRRLRPRAAARAVLEVHLRRGREETPRAQTFGVAPHRTGPWVSRLGLARHLPEEIRRRLELAQTDANLRLLRLASSNFEKFAETLELRRILKLTPRHPGFGIVEAREEPGRLERLAVAKTPTRRL